MDEFLILRSGLLREADVARLRHGPAWVVVPFSLERMSVAYAEAARPSAVAATFSCMADPARAAHQMELVKTCLQGEYDGGADAVAAVMDRTVLGALWTAMFDCARRWREVGAAELRAVQPGSPSLPPLCTHDGVRHYMAPDAYPVHRSAWSARALRTGCAYVPLGDLCGCAFYVSAPMVPLQLTIVQPILMSPFTTPKVLEWCCSASPTRAGARCVAAVRQPHMRRGMLARIAGDQPIVACTASAPPAQGLLVIDTLNLRHFYENKMPGARTSDYSRARLLAERNHVLERDAFDAVYVDAEDLEHLPASPAKLQLLSSLCQRARRLIVIQPPSRAPASATPAGVLPLVMAKGPYALLAEQDEPVMVASLLGGDATSLIAAARCMMQLPPRPCAHLEAASLRLEIVPLNAIEQLYSAAYTEPRRHDEARAAILGDARPPASCLRHDCVESLWPALLDEAHAAAILRESGDVARELRPASLRALLSNNMLQGRVIKDLRDAPPAHCLAERKEGEVRAVRSSMQETTDLQDRVRRRIEVAGDLREHMNQFAGRAEFNALMLTAVTASIDAMTSNLRERLSGLGANHAADRDRLETAESHLRRLRAMADAQNTCSVCYDASDILLQCSHTLCSRCVMSMAGRQSGSLACPVCRERTSTRTGVSRTRPLQAKPVSAMLTAIARLAGAGRCAVLCAASMVARVAAHLEAAGRAPEACAADAVQDFVERAAPRDACLLVAPLVPLADMTVRPFDALVVADTGELDADALAALSRAARSTVVLAGCCTY